MIDEVILCKNGEIVLKGQNRRNFESLLVKELRRRAYPHGKFKIYINQSTIYVEPLNEMCDMDGRLLIINLKNAVRSCSAAKLLNKLRFKALAICSLKNHLTEFTKYNFLDIHCPVPYLIISLQIRSARFLS